MVGGADGESDTLILPEDGFNDKDIRDVHPAIKGVVEDKNIAGLYIPLKFLKQRFHREGNGAKVEGNGYALRDHLAVSVTKGGGVVETVPDDG